jgi:hypothetical protein
MALMAMADSTAVFEIAALHDLIVLMTRKGKTKLLKSSSIL